MRSFFSLPRKTFFDLDLMVILMVKPCLADALIALITLSSSQSSSSIGLLVIGEVVMGVGVGVVAVVFGNGGRVGQGGQVICGHGVVVNTGHVTSGQVTMAITSVMFRYTAKHW